MQHNCEICGRELVNRASVERGIGPICWSACRTVERNVDLFGGPDFRWRIEAGGAVVAVIDLDRGGKSVTNGAEEVIDTLRSEIPDLGKRVVIYRDSLGVWDGLRVDAEGRFAGYYPIRTATCEGALRKIKARIERAGRNTSWA